MTSSVDSDLKMTAGNGGWSVDCFFKKTALKLANRNLQNVSSLIKLGCMECSSLSNHETIINESLFLFGAMNNVHAIMPDKESSD